MIVPLRCCVLFVSDFAVRRPPRSFGVVVWELVRAQAPDLLEVEHDHGRGPVLARLLALLERGCRLRLDDDGQAGDDAAATSSPQWARNVVDACLVLQASRRPRFSRLLTELENVADAAVPAASGGAAAVGESGV